MSEAKKLCAFRLKNDIAEIIKQCASDMHCSQGEYIEYIIGQIKKKDILNSPEDLIKRTHKSVTYIDSTVQQIHEMLNILAYDLNCKTGANWNDKIKTEPYMAAKDIVNNRIRKARLGKSKNLY